MKNNRRRFLKSTGLAAASLLLSSCKGPHLQLADRKERRPNIVFIIADDQPRRLYNYLPEGKYRDGRPRNLTPNLDRFETEGVVFTRGYCCSTVCVPSRFNCMTGMYASRADNAFFSSESSRTGQTSVEWNSFVTPQTQTLPRMLKAGGYVTGAVGKNHVIDCPDWISVDHDADPRDPEIKKVLEKNQTNRIEAYEKCGFDYAANIYENINRQTAPNALVCHNLDWIFKGGLDFIDQNNDKPFFLYIALTVSHGPAWHESWNGDPLATAAGLLDERLDIMPPRRSIIERVRAAGLEDNTADMTWIDDGVGAVMDKLKEHNIDDNTVIFFFNDQGVETGGKGHLYETGTITPTMVWGPGVFQGGRRIDQPVQNVDFAPTIMDLCQVTPPPCAKLDGRSFVPILHGHGKKIHKSLFFEMGSTRAVIKGDYKYLALRYPAELAEMTFTERKRVLDAHIKWQWEADRWKREVTDPNTPFGHMGNIPGGTTSTIHAARNFPAYYEPDRLYNLRDDPGEQANLANSRQYQHKLEEMKLEMMKYLYDLPGPFGDLKATP